MSARGDLANDRRPVMIAAGGTGGHVFPGLAVADELRERGVPVVWMGTRSGIEGRLVPAAGIDVVWLDVAGLRGKGWQARLLAPLRLLRGCGQALLGIIRHRPRAVLGMGGFAAGPGGLMARLTLRPLVIHEQNAVAGLTNRVLARIAGRVLSAMPDAFGDRPSELVGNPLRGAITRLPAPADRMAARRGPVRLLVLGGSLGAASLNALLPKAIAALSVPLEVRHQAGRDKLEQAREAYAAAGVEVDAVAFIDDMAAAYAWADLVVCRAGATTLAEIAAVGVASLLIPYPHAVDDHQMANARYLAEAGAAELLRQPRLDQQRLEAVLQALCEDRARLLEMAEKARRLARTDAAARVADIVLEVSR